MSDLKVREITTDDYGAWNIYVLAHKDSSFCHLAEWKTIVEEGAGHQCPYLVAEEKDTIVGILPLTLRKSLLFGNALISNMFCVYGGAVVSHAEARTALEKAAWKIAEKAGLEAVEYRSVKASHHGTAGWSVADDVSATFIKPLKNTPEDILLDIPRKQRAVVRKSLKSTLEMQAVQEVDTFYQLYAESVRNLGTPVFPKKLFSLMAQHFGDKLDIHLVKTSEGAAIASLMSFYFKGTVSPYYAGGTPACRAVGAHDFMYYQLMVHAAKKGIEHFDFGRSKVGSGPYKFKKNWGFEPTSLEYEYQLAEGAEVPKLDPTSGKYSLMVKVWKKLPLFVANRLGPLLARHLG